ncbi:MAG: hypothetical protein ACOYMH_11105, partial [Zwartia sp.]
KIRTPALITAQGWFSALSRIMAQPNEVEPKSSASLYRNAGIYASLFVLLTCNRFRDTVQALIDWDMRSER